MPTSLKRRLRSTADQAFRLCGLLARRERELSGGLTVLTYHRVLDRDRCSSYPFPSLAMPVDVFREEMRWLARNAEVVPLGRALEHPAGSPSLGPRPLFAVTFDDGYRDSSETVAGILEDLGLRGTFFVTTGFVETGGMMWFDEAALLFSRVPEHVRRDVVLQVSGGASGLPPIGSNASAWTAHLKHDSPGERRAILAALADVAGGVPTVGAPLRDGFEPMSIAQAVDLHRRGHEIGSHTITHPILTTLDDPELAHETAGSRNILSSWIGAAPLGFCYPNGDHDERVIAAVRRAGYAYACTTSQGIHRAGTDPFRIRRRDMVADRVVDASQRFDATAFRRELCGLYRRRSVAE